MKNKLYKILLVLLPIFTQWACTKEIEPIAASVNPITISNTEGFRAGTNVKFSDSATNSSSVKWEFLFNSSQLIESTTEVSPTRKFSTPGNYTVIFKAIGSGGSAGIKNTFTINPNVDFSVSGDNNFEAPCEVTVTASSNTGIAEFEWNWGDGTSNSKTSSSSAKHKYNKEGDYNIILSVRYSSNGISASIPLKIVTIKPTSLKVTNAWAAGGPLDDIGSITATDQAGNVYVAGSFKSNSCSFGPTASGQFITLNRGSGNTPLFVTKYTNSGVLVWVKQYENSTNIKSPYPTDIAISKNNTLYVSYINKSVDALSFGSGFLKFNAQTGSVMREKFFFENDTDINGLALDSDENIIVGGSFVDAFERTTYEKNKRNVGFVMKYNSNGDAIWKSPKYFYSVGSSGYSYVENVAVAKDNSIYFTAVLNGINNTSSPNGLVASTITCQGYNTIIGKLGVNGIPVWTRQDGVGNTNQNYDSYPQRLIIDNDNNAIFLTELYGGSTITFGTKTLAKRLTNSGDTFLVKYKSDGTIDFLNYASYNYVYVRDLSKDNDDNILVATFNAVSKLTNTGDVIFENRVLFNSNDSYVNSITTDMNNNVFVTGVLSGQLTTTSGSTLISKGGSDMFMLRYGK